jgi:hypothetical protein
MLNKSRTYIQRNHVHKETDPSNINLCLHLYFFTIIFQLVVRHTTHLVKEIGKILTVQSNPRSTLSRIKSELECNYGISLLMIEALYETVFLIPSLVLLF